MIDAEFPWVGVGGGVTIWCSASRGVSSLGVWGGELIASDHRTGRVHDGLE